MTPDDEEFLRRAIALARTSRDAGQAPYGSLLVGPDGRVLAEDHNTVLADGDIAAHPEQKLARWAARELDRATAAATTWDRCSGSAALPATAIACSRPPRVSTAWSSVSWVRPVMTTRAPSATRRCAIASPIPRDAPVMIAVRPSRLIS